MKTVYIKYVLTIDGMRCGSCEAHVNNLIRKKYSFIKKVKSSARKNRTIILSKDPIDMNELKTYIDETGYIVQGVAIE